MRLGVADGRRRFRLVKRIASFVFLAHTMDNEHDDRNGKNQTNDSQTNAH